MRHLLLATTAAALLAGCTTPYQEMGALGGVHAVRISEDTAQIRAQGNAYTDPDTIQQYVLRRAAEETLTDGYDLFRIVGDQDRTNTGSASFGSASGNRWGAWGSAFSMPIVKPGETILIKMLKGAPPVPMPDGEFDARDVEAHLAALTANADHKSCVTGADGKVDCK
jgi:hypothetical protein